MMKILKLSNISTSLNTPPAAIRLIIKRPLEGKEPVQVDEDKVVDGGAHKDDDQAGDDAAPEAAEVCPPARAEGVEGEDDATEHISHSQGDDDQVVGLFKKFYHFFFSLNSSED